MVEHGMVIRAIPFEHHFRVEARHKNRYPHGIEYYDELLNRTMLKVTEINPRGGKFLITSEATQSSMIRYWGKPSGAFDGKPVVFYDSIEEAVSSFICALKDKTEDKEFRWWVNNDGE
jgi:hypothetical protein